MTLNEELLEAHATNNISALVDLYTRAADQSENTSEICFFLTQAYIFSLDQDHPSQAVLYRRLKVFERV